MPPVGFKLTISAGEQPQTYALDRAASHDYVPVLIKLKFIKLHVSAHL